MVIEDILRNFDTLEELRGRIATGSIIKLDDEELDANTFSDVYIDITTAFDKIDMNKDEQLVLSMIIYGFGYSEIARATKMQRQEIATIFKSLCHRFQEVLGGDYTTNL